MLGTQQSEIFVDLKKIGFGVEGVDNHTVAMRRAEFRTTCCVLAIDKERREASRRETENLLLQ